MTKITRNRTVAAFVISSTMEANNMSELFHHVKFAKTSTKKPTKQTNVKVSDFKNVQNAQKHIKIDNKVNGVIVKSKNNSGAFIVILVWDRLNKYIKVLNAKKKS